MPVKSCLNHGLFLLVCESVLEVEALDDDNGQPDLGGTVVWEDTGDHIILLHHPARARAGLTPPHVEQHCKVLESIEQNGNHVKQRCNVSDSI